MLIMYLPTVAKIVRQGVDLQNARYPMSRLRRNRIDSPTRALVRETRLTSESLILPVFVTDAGTSTAIQSMPGVLRQVPDDLWRTVDKARNLGIRAFALFPHSTRPSKDATGTEALNARGLIPSAIREFKQRFPDCICIADIALDPYTSHGQDGVIDASGYIVNDQTVTMLSQMALVCAHAGADIVAPSDMMDGRIGAIRTALEGEGLHNTRVLAYSAKYASAFYGPFRDAVGSAKSLGGRSKDNYQMDPANADEALRECAFDISEGADFLMVKPAGPYLDVIRRVKDRFQFPIFAYQVSGEYSMIKFAAQAGAIDEESCMMESLLAIRRAGADAILTYFAIEAAEKLRKS